MLTSMRADTKFVFKETSKFIHPQKVPVKTFKTAHPGTSVDGSEILVFETRSK